MKLKKKCKSLLIFVICIIYTQSTGAGILFNGPAVKALDLVIARKSKAVEDRIESLEEYMVVLEEYILVLEGRILHIEGRLNE